MANNKSLIHVVSLLGGLLLLIPSLACKQALLVGVTADDPINEWARRQCISITNSDFVSLEDTSSLELLNASHLLVVGDTKDSVALVALSLSMKQMHEEAWYLVPRSKPNFLDGISACNPDIVASIVSVSASYDCFHRSAEYMPPSLVSLIGPADGATIAFTSSSREPELELSFNLSAHAFSNEILKYFLGSEVCLVRVTIDAHIHHFIHVSPDLHFSGETMKATVSGLEAGTHSFEACLLFGPEAEAAPLGARSEPTLVEVVYVEGRAVPGPSRASSACHWSSVLAPVNEEMIARPVSTSGMPRSRPLSIALVELCFTPTPSLALERRHWVSAVSLLPRDRFLFSYFAFGCDNSTGASSGQTLSVTLANAGVEVRYSHASPASTSLVGGESKHELSRIKNSADVVVLLLSATTEVGSEVVSSSAQRLCNFITSDDDSGQAMVCLVEPIEQRSGARRRDQPLLSDVPWSEAAPSVDAVLTTSFAAANSLRSTNSPVIEVTPGVAASLRSHFNANAHRNASAGGSECPTSQVVVWVGELEPSYSPGLMLRACAALVNDSTTSSNGRDTCVRCVFLGTGTLHRPLQVLAQRLGVAHLVAFRQIEDGDGAGGYASVLSLLQGAGVLVSTRASLPAPSSHAALWLDAAAMGLPLVATPPTTQREWSDDVLCDGWNGLVAGSRSPEALKEAIEKVFAPVVHFKGKEEQSVSSLSTLGVQMGERGSRLVRHRFEAHTSATSLAEALAGSHRSARALRGFKKKKTKRLLDGVATEDARSGSSVGGEEEEHGMVPGTPRFTGGVRMLRRQKRERHTSTILGNGDVPCEGVVCRRLPSAPPRDLLSIRNVAVVHYRPPEQPLSSFEVGFREALALLNQLKRVNATMVNLHDLEAADSSEVSASACRYFEAFDSVWVKSNWEYVVDAFAREFIDCAVPRALLVSGSYPPPSVAALFAYDALAFEVFRYEEEHLWAHPLATHAFGIDTRVMAKARTMECNSVTCSACGEDFEWDVLFIGAFADHFGHKRPTWIGTSERFKGLRRAAIGKQNGPKAAQVVDELKAQGVAVLAPLPYHDLAKLIQRSRVVYVPDDVFGGGERAVLEARSLGVEVAIEDDNPKLKELLTSPVYDHMYYAQQLSRLQDMLDFSVRLALRE